MEQTNIDITIYRNGQYSLRDNLKIKANILLPKITSRIDRLFEQHA